jgi:6-phosphogluconolactonase
MRPFELKKFATDEELANAAASAWLDEIELANRAGKGQCVALSGGRITQKFLAATVNQAASRDISFSRVHFFWADERCVPPGDPDSNYKMANDLLFVPLKISAAQIHRIRGEEPPASAAKAAEAELRQTAPNQVFDLIFLGMGEDGHVASLFPGASPAIQEAATPFLVVENSPKPPPTRISLSFKAIFAATNVWVLVSGSGKRSALEESLSATGRTPLARVLQGRTQTCIFSDI